MAPACHVAAPVGYLRVLEQGSEDQKSAVAGLEKEVTKVDPADKPDLEERLRFFQSTDMAAGASPI